MKINIRLARVAKAVVSISLASLFCLGVQAQSSTPTGLEIAQEQKTRDKGWDNSVAEVTMILRNAQGQESSRKIRSKALEIENDGDKALTIFEEPRDVQGTAFLSFSHATEPDEQWIYLPALKRVKRISTSNKSGPFMGSEFAYEDMTSFELEKFEFNYLGEEVFKGTPVYLLEQIPVDEFSGYSRQKVWLDKERYIPLKVEYYDRKNSLLKTLLMTNYKQYLGKFWRPDTSIMINAQNGKSTSLVMHSIEFKTGLEESDFDKNSLKRAR